MSAKTGSVQPYTHPVSSVGQKVFDKRQFSGELKRLNFPELEKILRARGFTEKDFIELSWAKGTFFRYSYHLFRISIEKMDRELFDAISLVYLPSKEDMSFLEIYIVEFFCSNISKGKSYEVQIYMLFNVLEKSSNAAFYLSLPLKKSAEIGSLNLVMAILERFPKTDRTDAITAARENYDEIIDKRTPEALTYAKIYDALAPQEVDASWILV